jgi:DNA/RNA-binding domain of Phe-tRNA-synthetase-like protein
MSFLVSPDCVRLGLRAGAVVLRGVHVAPAGPGLRAEIAQEARAIAARFPTPQAVRSSPEIVRFHHLLRQVGVNPRKEQPSLERLLTYACKRADLPAVNCLVDAYNLVSVRWSCSLGAHDLDRLALPVALRLLTGEESFTPLGQDSAVAVVPGTYGYVDADKRVLCHLDVRQAEVSKVTAHTVNALLIVEGTAAHAPDTLRQAFGAAVEVVGRWCGGTAEVLACPV